MYTGAPRAAWRALRAWGCWRMRAGRRIPGPQWRRGRGKARPRGRRRSWTSRVDDLYVAGNAFPDDRAASSGLYQLLAGIRVRPASYCSGGIGRFSGRLRGRPLSVELFRSGLELFVSARERSATGVVNDNTRRFVQPGSGDSSRIGAAARWPGSRPSITAWGVSQGWGTITAAGILWDSEGDDLYRGSWLYGGAEMPMDSCLLDDLHRKARCLSPWPGGCPGATDGDGWGQFGWRIVTWIRWGSFSYLSARTIMVRSIWMDFNAWWRDVGVLVDLQDGR
jgi:hypothetical protein